MAKSGTPPNRKTASKKEGQPSHKRYSKSREQSADSAKATSNTLRLNRYIANAGICSRREADTYIAAGSVSVNGTVVTTMGYQVKPSDEVRFEGRKLELEKKEYVLLNKPKNFITTTRDEKGRRMVMELVAKASTARLLPVGRLDRNTTGLLLFTNDGDIAKKLTHPKHGVRKLYHVYLDTQVSAADIQRIKSGLKLQDGPVKVTAVSYIQGASKQEVGLELHSGRNRIVRRIFEHLGYQVVKLDRVVFAGFTKKNLPRGHWRHLTEQEVVRLKMIR